MNTINPNSNTFTGNYAKLTERVAKSFARKKESGEGLSIACDFLGKAILVPVVIMASSNEPKEKKEYSALKNPVAATIQLMMEVPILAVGSTAVSKAANNGFFDKAGSDFTYNEKLCKEKFIDAFEKCPNLKNQDEFVQNIKKKGYTKEIAEKFDDIAADAGKCVNEEVKSAFKNLENAHQNQFHLKNRICFVAALALTPVLCSLENKIHPIIMDKIYEKRNKKTGQNLLKSGISIENFIQKTKKAIYENSKNS